MEQKKFKVGDKVETRIFDRKVFATIINVDTHNYVAELEEPQDLKEVGNTYYTYYLEPTHIIKIKAPHGAFKEIKED